MINEPLVNDEDDAVLPYELQNLTTLLDNSLETLITGNSEIQTEALSTAKHIFEISVRSEECSRPHILNFISALSSLLAPRTRSQTKARVQPDAQVHEHTKPEFFQLTPLNTLFTDGMDAEQVWAQLDIRMQTISRILDRVLEGGNEPSIPTMVPTHEGDSDEEDDSDEDEDEDERFQNVLEALGRSDDEVDLHEFLAMYGLDDDLDDSQEEVLEQSSSESDNGGEVQEDIFPLRDESESSSGEEESEYHLMKTSRKRKRANLSGLDDGFFDVAEFHSESERAEARSSSRGRLSGDSDEDEEQFNLYSSNVVLDNEVDHNIFYRDFFEPPKKIRKTSPIPNSNPQVRFHEDVRVRKIRATGKNRSLREDDLNNLIHDEDDASDGEDNFDDEDDESSDSGNFSEEGSISSSEIESNEGSIVQRLKHDLFSEEMEEGGNDLTTHEKRMATIRDQISLLESENVAPKEWTQMGEAGSRQRPQNSLLEEDLEFERVRKAVPVITEEVVHSLEERIKARILQGQFDDVVRIKSSQELPFLPSKIIELQDTKSKQSLAQIYETEYLASQPGGQLPDDRDGRLKKEHDEIAQMWDKISTKLDALCNAHFVPKQPKATITTVENTPSVMMESTLPTSKSVASMLAPEEVFSAQAPLKAASELTPAEKRARRGKVKKLRKRQRDSLEKRIGKLAKAKDSGGVRKEKQAALNTLMKQGKGVTVVGKERVSQRKSKKQ